MSRWHLTLRVEDGNTLAPIAIQGMGTDSLRNLGDKAQELADGLVTTVVTTTLERHTKHVEGGPE